jgi:hypothetical protein
MQRRDEDSASAGFKVLGRRGDALLLFGGAMLIICSAKLSL